MKLLRPRLPLVLFTAALMSLAQEAMARNVLTPGTYQLVGSMRNGTGFDGTVAIDESQAAGLSRVDVLLTNGYLLRGTVVDGNFQVEEARRGRSKIRANGTVTMLGPGHAVGRITVRGQGRGIIMLGRL